MATIPTFIATLALAISLGALSYFDLSTRRLPDWLTLPLIALGCLNTGLTNPSAFYPHVLAALAGFLLFYLIALAYLRLRKLPGLGLGDAKLLAAAGAWLGPLYLAPTIFLAALLALGAALILRLLGRAISWRTTLPFGPFLSAAFLIFWCVKQIDWPLAA